MSWDAKSELARLAARLAAAACAADPRAVARRAKEVMLDAGATCGRARERGEPAKPFRRIAEAAGRVTFAARSDATRGEGREPGPAAEALGHLAGPPGGGGVVDPALWFQPFERSGAVFALRQAAFSCSNARLAFEAAALGVAACELLLAVGALEDEGLRDDVARVAREARRAFGSARAAWRGLESRADAALAALGGPEADARALISGADLVVEEDAE